MPVAVNQILALQDVAYAEAPPYDAGLDRVTLTLAPGDLALVALDPARPRTPLPDAACGLLDLESGNVAFLEKDWCRVGPSAAARRRGQIGRVFDRHSWVSNLNVDENVLLPHVHHRHAALAKLRKDADALARQFGLPGLPDTRPVATRGDDLKRAACVRAFLGGPCLLILERPVHGLGDLLPPLVAATAEARARGAAVLWLDLPSALAGLDELKPSARFRLEGPRLLPLDAATG